MRGAVRSGCFQLMPSRSMTAGLASGGSCRRSPAATRSDRVRGAWQTCTDHLHWAQQLDDVAAPSTERKDMAAERIVVQSTLHLGRQTIKAAAHVGESSGAPYACARRQPHHARRLWKIVLGSAASTPARTRTAAPAKTTSIVDNAVAGVACAAVTTGTGASARTTGSSVVVVCGDASSNRPARNSPRHLNTMFAFTSLAIASVETDTPASHAAAASRRLNSTGCNFGIASPLPSDRNRRAPGVVAVQVNIMSR